MSNILEASIRQLCVQVRAALNFSLWFGRDRRGNPAAGTAKGRNFLVSTVWLLWDIVSVTIGRISRRNAAGEPVL